MDTYDATKMILTRIQSLDQENASKIMGYILIQDLGDKELIRLAHGPENHLVSLINQAKSFLRISTNGSHFLQLNSPKIMVPSNENNGFQLKSPVLSSSPCSPWSNTSNGFSAFSRKCPVSASYAAVVNGAQSNTNTSDGMACGSSSSALSLAMNSCNTTNLGQDEFHGDLQVQDHLSYSMEDSLSMSHPPIMSPSGRSDSVLWNYEDHSTPQHNPFHRRSCSVNDAYLFDDIDGAGQNGNLLGGWRPCMYYARGFCKNGNSCKFSHNLDADLALVGSPNNMDGLDWLRMKQIKQQRLAATELIASGPRHSFPYKRSTTAALMGEEFHKFGPFGPDLNSFSGMGLDCNSSSRQIYLTFPADSPFTEEDVSNYFSMYGPVQDVRIPYQQKRMFGFVTFIYSETVNLILAKGNPHFVCDSRVLVKPYKEKGKVAEKKRQRHQLQLLDRGEFPACLSPTGFEAREPYDLPFGERAFYNAKEMMLKNKLEEQAELQQAIELQGRRLMNMHLMDLKNNYNNHQPPPSFPHSLPLSSRLQTHPQMFQNVVHPSDGVDVEVKEGDDPATAVIEKTTKEVSGKSDDNDGCEGECCEDKVKFKDADFRESLGHNLPDNLFASPTRTLAEHRSLSVSVPTELDANYPAALSSTLGSVESCHFQMPRFPSGQGVVEM